jgi:hypothetical protein
VHSDKEQPHKKVLKFAARDADIDTRLVNWVRGVANSNEQLVSALGRLRESYKSLLAGRPVSESEQILWQVEGALTGAAMARDLLTQCSPPGPERA